MYRIARVLVAIVLFSAAAGCGEDGPTEVTEEVDVPPLTANLVIEGGAWVSCGSTSCNYAGEFRNIGNGCAWDVDGTLKLLDQSGAQIGITRTWDRINPFTKIRPGQLFTFAVQGVTHSTDLAHPHVFDIEVAWTNVAC